MRFFITPNFPPGYFVAITLWPVGIFFNSKQQKEMGGILFYVWYLVEYLIKLIRYRNTDIAYRAISFEREATYNQGSYLYLVIRKRYAWIKFL
jgi:hypothetical protein